MEENQMYVKAILKPTARPDAWFYQKTPNVVY